MLIVTGAGCVFSQPHYLLAVCQEAVDPLTEEVGTESIVSLGRGSFGIMVLKAELKSTNRILT